MRKTYKYRIYLQGGQRRILNTMLEECRWVYNQTLEAREFAYEHSIKCELYETQAMLPGWKETRPSLKLVHSQVLQNVQLRVDLAFQAFFRRVKAGEEEVGYPRFKGFGRYDSITYPQYGNGVEIRGNDLVVSKIGRVQVVWHRPTYGAIKTVTLRRSRTGKWYVSFSCEVEPKRLLPTEHVVGVDVGLLSFATLSNGEQIENPRFYSRDLVDRYQVIVFEDLEPQQMGAKRGRGMRKSIMDVAWTQFISMTRGKAEEAGRTVILVNPRNTSIMCSHCGELVEKDLSVRVHTCPHCGLVLGRDQNAAINILRLGLQNLRL